MKGNTLGRLLLIGTTMLLAAGLWLEQAQAQGEECNASCDSYCRDQGYHWGTHTGGGVCLLGVPENPAGTCACRQ